MKEYSDKKRNARQSLIVIGNTVLLRQNRAETLTPAYDPSPYSVTGVKGLWSRLKGWERSKPGTRHISNYLDMQGRRSMTCWTGIKTALVTPKKRRELSWVGSLAAPPLKEPSSQFARDGSSRALTSNCWPHAAGTHKVRARSKFHVEHSLLGLCAELDKRGKV